MSRILLADDSPQALRLAEQILKHDGTEVVSVTDGATALRRLPDVDPDLLIIDVYLTGRNAFDVARVIRSQTQYQYLRMIFAAAPADDFNEQDARNAGADVILRKPFEASSLLTAVNKLLKQSKDARASSKPQNPRFDRALIRAAVTLALDRAMPAMVEELTEHLTTALARDFRDS